MLEVTGLGNVLRALTYVYWLLAIGALALALVKGNGWRRKVIWSCVVVVVFGFLPVKALVEKYQRDAFAKKAWAYFEKLCDERSGYKIYKTFTGVKSVVVTKPLPPATEKDLYDQFWKGDPYSTEIVSSDRAIMHALTIVGRQKFVGARGDIGLDFFEIADANGNDRYLKVEPLHQYPYKRVTSIAKPSSRFALIWDDISTEEDRRHWVAASRLRILDLADDSVVAERVGFLIESGFGSTSGHRRPWQTSRTRNTTCPSLLNGTFEDRWFILKALDPIEGDKNGK